ncbi:MAG: FAD binding domain-containing protein [Bacteroides sp.]|nr:FAD binding domain-containing protein [Prevotella sp.]MCM1407240.1 FAD binding domain-containing protein [Treponema brennaborense]MCM1469728.1 FAD binding domain-containing protein [Bacteroides sp.]
MPDNSTVIYTPKTVKDALFYLKTIPDLHILNGCTGQLCKANEYHIPLPQKTLIINTIDELKQIELHERYLDIGAAVTLASIEELGKKKSPAVLSETLCAIANPLVRNAATIGGNICTFNPHGTLFAPLLALDAKFEIRSAFETKIIPAGKFSGVPAMHMLTRIRIPLDEWDISVFKKTEPAEKFTENSGTFVFLAKIQKNVLTDIRIIFCGMTIFRSAELENKLIGIKLPVSEKNITIILDAAAQLYDNFPAGITTSNYAFNKCVFLNLLNYSLSRLT